MLKKELAEALGISPAAVTKLSKRGMPTDSVDRAQRWRRRHLEPSRVKGVRFEPMLSKPSGLGAIGSIAEMAVLDFSGHEKSLRALLRSTGDTKAQNTRIPGNLWVKLVDHVLSHESPARKETSATVWMNCHEFAKWIGSAFDGLFWLDIARDLEDYASLGFSHCGDLEATEGAGDYEA